MLFRSLLSSVEAVDQALRLWSKNEMIESLDYSKVRAIGTIGNVDFPSHLEYARLMVVFASDDIANMITLVEKSGLFLPGKFVMYLESEDIYSV